MATLVEPSASRSTPRVSSSVWDSFEIPDGYRAEIIREELVVTPSPVNLHQVAVTKLIVLFYGLVPEGWLPVTALEWRFDHHGYVARAPQPDIMVKRPKVERVVEPPLLAVEVLSPSDHHKLDTQDMTRIEGKRLDFADFGLVDYLEVDFVKDRREIRRYELIDGRLTVVETVRGDEVLAADRPFAYTLRPVDLLP